MPWEIRKESVEPKIEWSDIEVLSIMGRENLKVKLPLVKKYNLINNKIISVAPFETDLVENAEYTDWNQVRYMILQKTIGGIVINCDFSQFDRSWIFEGAKVIGGRVSDDSYVWSSEVRDSVVRESMIRDCVIKNCTITNASVTDCVLQDCTIIGATISNKKFKGSRITFVAPKPKEIEEEHKDEEDKRLVTNRYKLSFGADYFTLKVEYINVKAGDEDECKEQALARKNFLKKKYTVVVLSDKHGLVR